jgi:hypothetical protein
MKYRLNENPNKDMTSVIKSSLMYAFAINFLSLICSPFKYDSMWKFNKMSNNLFKKGEVRKRTTKKMNSPRISSDKAWHSYAKNNCPKVSCKGYEKKVCKMIITLKKFHTISRGLVGFIVNISRFIPSLGSRSFLLCKSNS